MIEYEIVVNHKRDQKIVNEIVKPGDPNFQEVVFRRNLRACKYKPEDRVKIRGTSIRGFVTHIEEDITKINWEVNRPQFVEVRFDDNTVKMCNPSQLKGSSK